MKKLVLSICFAVSVSFVPITAYAQTNYENETKTVESDDYEYYEGKVTSGVNVRKKAGADQEKLTYNGKGVTLDAGTIVTIIDTVDVGSKPWYHIKFTYKGKEMTGFSTSSYIEKTGVEITPIPTPEPTVTEIPTRTPTPTATPEPTQEPEVTKAPEMNTKNDSGSPSAFLWIVIILVVLGAGGGAACYFITRPVGNAEDAKKVADKIARLKTMVIPKEQEGHRKHRREEENTQKKEVLVYKGDKIVPMEDLKQGNDEVYVKAKEDTDILLDSYDEVEEKSDSDSDDAAEKVKQYKESNDRTALRIAVNRLREHDIIIHKYFGRGEVFDNSDVKLIEVRFGQDTRFLNKEQMIHKKLVQITNESNR